jgi:hypothetical protein
MPKKRPAYRADRDHLSFLGKIKDYIPTVDEFELQLCQQLENKFDVKMHTPAELSRITQGLMQGVDVKDVIRTKLESVEEHILLNSQIPSLVRTGPSCTIIA